MSYATKYKNARRVGNTIWIDSRTDKHADSEEPSHTALQQAPASTPQPSSVSAAPVPQDSSPASVQPYRQRGAVLPEDRIGLQDDSAWDGYISPTRLVVGSSQAAEHEVFGIEQPLSRDEYGTSAEWWDQHWNSYDEDE
jgi:hypothetical protein